MILKLAISQVTQAMATQMTTVDLKIKTTASMNYQATKKGIALSSRKESTIDSFFLMFRNSKMLPKYPFHVRWLKSMKMIYSVKHVAHSNCV